MCPFAVYFNYISSSLPQEKRVTGIVYNLEKMGESEAGGISMKTIELESVENNEKHPTDEDPKVNYRGWKVMPFIIGKNY